MSESQQDIIFRNVPTYFLTSILPPDFSLLINEANRVCEQYEFNVNFIVKISVFCVIEV